MEYDRSGRITKETVFLDDLPSEGDDRITMWAYSDALRTVTKTLPDVDGPAGLPAPVYVETFDLRGNLLRLVEPDPDGPGPANPLVSPVTDYVYDRMSRLKKLLGAEVMVNQVNVRPTTEFQYDKSDLLTKEIDPLLRQTLRGYDAFGRLLTLKLPDPLVIGGTGGAVTTHEWDKAGNLVGGV